MSRFSQTVRAINIRTGLLTCAMMALSFCDRADKISPEIVNLTKPTPQQESDDRRREFLLAEAEKLQLSGREDFRRKISKIREDLLVEEVLQHWAREDSTPEAIVKCFDKEKELFRKSRVSITAIMPKVESAQNEILNRFQRNGIAGDTFDAMAEKLCDSGPEFCGVQGKLGVIFLEDWLHSSTGIECPNLRLEALKPSEEWVGICRTRIGMGVFRLRALEPETPMIGQISDKLKEHCVRSGRLRRLSSMR